MFKSVLPTLCLASLIPACFTEPPPYPGGGNADTAEADPLGDDAQAFASDSSDPAGTGTGASDGTTSSPPDSGASDDDDDRGDGAPTSPDANPVAPCGDGILGATEECDDGNVLPGDGCSEECRIELTGCANGAEAIADDPVAGMAVCRDPTETTCEEDFASLCANGWHLCSAAEHVAKNDGWSIELGERRALGAIRCRLAGGAGHYTVANLDADGANNCQIGSSRAECPSAFGCNETLDYALCCSRITTCGDGVVDPLEECDDANTIDGDDCSNACISKTATGLDC